MIDIQKIEGLKREEYVELLNTIIKAMDKEGIKLVAGLDVCSNDILTECYKEGLNTIEIW